VPDRSVVYSGDKMFVEGHPILWAGTIPDLLSALDVIDAWAPEVIVPGHGPVTDLAGVREIRAYYEYCHGQARECFEAGMDLATAAATISLDRWADWGEPERIVTLLDTCFREFSGRSTQTPMAELFALMAAQWDTARTSGKYGAREGSGGGAGFGVNQLMRASRPHPSRSRVSGRACGSTPARSICSLLRRPASDLRIIFRRCP